MSCLKKKKKSSNIVVFSPIMILTEHMQLKFIFVVIERELWSRNSVCFTLSVQILKNKLSCDSNKNVQSINMYLRTHVVFNSFVCMIEVIYVCTLKVVF